MATSRYLQPRQPGGRRTISSNPADQQENDPNGVYIPGRAGRMDARPRNALYLPGTGPGTGRTGIRTGIVNRDGSTSPLSSMGYRTGPLSETRPSSLPDPNNPDASSASNSSASYTRTPHSDTQESDAPDTGTETQDTNTQNTSDPNSGGQGDRPLNPNAPLVYNPISLDNPGGNFVMQGATIADSSYMPDGSNNDAPQNNDDNESPRKRINARPRNNIYMPGTGPGTGRTAIRTDTINRDGTTSPVSSMGYATGPLSQTRPSSPPDKKPVITQESAAAPAAATPGLPETLKSSTRQFGSNGEQKMQPLAPLTPAVIPSTIDLPSSSKPTIAPNAITSGVSGSIKASTQQFGSPLGAPKPAAAPPANRTTANLDTLKTSTPPLGTTPPLNTKAPALALTSSLGGIPTPKPSTGLDTIGLSSKPYGSTAMSGPLDLLGVKKRAMGGPVRAGRPYLVGEEGPELIVPKQSGTVVPNHALSYQPLDKAPSQFPSPVGGYTDEPASDGEADDEARNPASDASFDEPHSDTSEADRQLHEISFDEHHADTDEATDTEFNAETIPASPERPTTGLMMRPRPMPPEFAQQQQQARSGMPVSSHSFGSSPDAPPESQHDDKFGDHPGMPWDNRPPQTQPATPAATGSRWLQKLQPPGARGQQAARDAGQQQPGMQPYQAAAPAQRQGGGQAAPGQTAPPAKPTSNGRAITPPTAALPGYDPEGFGIQLVNQVQRRDDTGWDKKPVQRLPGKDYQGNKPKEQYQKELAAYNRASENHKFNTDSEDLKAWENYHRAIALMEKTPEGLEVLKHLRGDKNRVFEIVMVDELPEYRGVTLKDEQNGRYSNVVQKDKNGREIHIIMLKKSALKGYSLKANGDVNPDAESLEHVWHELYHASEGQLGRDDPLGFGTAHRLDRLKQQPYAHEKRAVRFENIIRARLKGTRVKTQYGGTYLRDKNGNIRRDANGNAIIIDVIDVKEPQPPLRPLR